MLSIAVVINTLTHLNLTSHKRDIGKQCRPSSDVTERSIWSGLHCLHKIQEFVIKCGNKTPIILEMDESAK